MTIEELVQRLIKDDCIEQDNLEVILERDEQDAPVKIEKEGEDDC